LIAELFRVFLWQRAQRQATKPEVIQKALCPFQVVLTILLSSTKA
jgi:hypothetical protein